MAPTQGFWMSWLQGLIGNGGGGDRSGSQTGRGAFSEPVASRLQWREGWQTSKNAFWNTTRYVLIAGMFALLLTMVILLNEVMTFHNGIVQQVGEPYARGVVLMLDEMNRHPEAYPEERALPVAELAVELDAVRGALAEIDRFAEIQPDRGPTREQATGQVAAGGGGGSAEVLFDDQSRTLQIRLDRLRDTVYSASPFVAVAAALKDLKSSVEELRRFDVSHVSAGAEPESGEGADGVSAAVALEGQIKRMSDELDALARGVRALPHAEPLSGYLANLKGQIERLQSYQYLPAADEQAGQPAALVASTSGEAKATAYETAGTVAAQAEAEAAKARAGTGNQTKAVTAEIEAGTGKKSQAVQAGQTPGINAAKAVADETTATMAAQAKTEDEKATARGRTPAADGVIISIEENTKNMERDLRAAFPHFSLFAAVSEQVQEMRDQAGAFEGMTGADYRGAIEELLDREAAEERFDQARDELGQAIDQLR